MICAGVSPAHGPEAMQSAAVPATRGEAKLVPEPMAYGNGGSRKVELMQTPGAATVWAWSAASAAKLLKNAELSSEYLLMSEPSMLGQAPVAEPRPPGCPSKSVMA